MTSVKKLYGGAIHAYLPSDSCDISEVRQVPDNQEVFAHSDSDQSIIFDILEYIPDVDDLKAIEQHFLALVGEKTEHEIVSVSKMDLNLAQCDGIFYLHGRSKVSKYREHAKNLIDMHLALFRYKSHATDILITFNDPILINPESSSYTMKEETEGTRKWTLDDFKKTVQTFTVIDFSLFAA